MLRTLLCLLSLILVVRGAEFSPGGGGGDLLRVLVRTRSGEVITSSNTTLYKLSDQLTIQNTVSYDGHLTVLTATTSGHLFLCDSSTCNLTTPNGNTVTINNFLRSGIKVTSVSLLPQSDPNIVYVHSSEIILSDNHRTFSIGTITIGESSYSDRRNIEESSIIQRTVVSTITTHQYVYYIVNHNEDDDVQVRLVRICANDTGETVDDPFKGIQHLINSYYELRLQCGTSGLSALSSAYISDVNGAHIIVSFSDMEGHHVLCDYKENVISSLFTDKFTECSQGIGYAGRMFNQGTEIMCRMAEMSSECAIGSDNEHSLEVDDPYDGDVVLSTNSGIVSLLTTNSYGFSYLFTATTDTLVHKYSVTINSSSSTLRESFSITVGPVTSLTASPDQTVIYALIPNKLVSFPGEQCDEHASCDQCLDQVDPVCGWCTLDNKCSTNDSCSSTFWISSNEVSSSDQCPTGSIIDNITISTEQLPYNVTVDVTNLPMREVDCVFTVGSMSTMGPAQLVDNSIICLITTHTSSLFTNDDTLLMSLSLRARGSNQSFLNVTGHITVFDCMSHTTCSGCLNSQHECSWCPYDVQCTATSPVSCDSGLEGNMTTTDSCPQLTPNDNYTLHMDTKQQLVVNGKNLLQDGGNYYCVVSYRGEEISVVGSWDPVEMTITCDERNFFFSSAAGQSRVTADLKVLWKTVNNYTIDEAVASVQVMLYQCHLLGTDCTSCLAQDKTHFDCVYCPEINCVFRSSCSVSPYDNCPAPMIDMFTPIAGPIEGGTVVTIEGSNLGMNFQDVMKIMIGNVNCTPNEDSYMVGRRVNCVTDVMNEPQSSSITIVTNNGAHDSSDHFYYKRVTVNQVYPNRGPMSGGTQINITGSNFNIGNSQNVLVGDKMCSMINITSEWITCETERGDVGVVDITIMVDNFNGTTSYTFVDDPTFTSISPVFSFTSGGTKFLVRGERLDIVQSPQLLLTITSSSGKRQAVMEFTGPCNALNDTALSCEAPTLPDDNSTIQLVRLGLVMDGVTQLRSLNETIQVYRDPVFLPLTKDNSSLVFELREYDVITINGSNFRFTTDQLMVKIGSEGSCRVLSSITLTSVECIPIEADYPVNQDIPLMVHLGNQVTTLGTIRFREEEEEGNSIVLIIIAVVVSAIVLVVLMLVFIIILYCFWRNSRRKDQKLDELQMTLSKLETNVAHECKEAFTQLLTDLDEYTGDLTNVTLPYFDFQTYMVKTVLSGLEETLLSSKFRNNQLPQLSKRLEEFHHLMMDKRFLLILIKTMEEQRDFSIREKCQMGNLLTVILHTRLDYLTQIMKLSMSELIRKSVAKDNYRVLLRRTDSVAERILSNWLALCLHQHILDQVGQPLYMLFRAIKGQLEKGPVDVVTGDARYSLSEQRIIRQQMPEVPEIIALVIAEENNIRANVRLLQCDTISQAKEKIFDHIYKSQPVSTRPYTFFNSDLHFMMANGRVTVLRDFDYTTIEDGEWKKVNTLCHYEVHKELNPCLKLVKKNRYTSEVTEFPATLVTTPNTQIKPHSNEEGQKYWHLFKHVDVDDPVMSPLLSKKLVTEVFFPRILYTKKVLQKFVDDLFKALFSIDHEPSTPCIHSRQFIFPNGNIPPPQTYTRGADTIPVAIKYLFDFLDHEAINTGVADPDVVHVWKNNSLSLRFWVNLIKNPEFVFDINKSLTMDSCLSIVAQAFIDGCSLSDVKLTKDSPTGKLLYNKDVMGYKHEVKRYYDEIRRLPQVSEETMITYLKGLSNYQVHQLIHDNYPFSLHSALYQLLKLTGRHSHKILENLREKGLDTPAMAYETILHEILTQV